MDQNVSTGINDDISNLRFLPTSLYRMYQANCERFKKVGNRKFAALVRQSLREPFLQDETESSYTVIHAWLPGEVLIKPTLFEELTDQSKSHCLSTQAKQFLQRTSDLGWLGGNSTDIEGLVRKATTSFLSIQNKIELNHFLAFLSRKQPEYVLEIGTARGGTLYALSQVAAVNAHLISIDLPGGENCGGQMIHERMLFSHFTKREQKLDFIPANSQLPETVECLRSLLNGNSLDLLFIDGDHSLDGVTADFKNYLPFVRSGGLIAFHDICLFPEEWGPEAGTGPFWRAIKSDFASIEFVDLQGTSKLSKPDDINWAWGIGVICVR